MNNYPVEPLMADKLKENLQKYYPNEENIEEYGHGIVVAIDNDIILNETL